MTFLGSQDSSRSLYAIPGLDYVGHEDVLPYTTSEKNPLQHELFDKFLMYDPERGDFLCLLHCFSVIELFLSRVCFRSTVRSPGNVESLAKEESSVVRVIRCS